MNIKLLSLLAIFTASISFSFAQIDGHHCAFDEVKERMYHENHEEWLEMKVAEERFNTYAKAYAEKKQHERTNNPQNISKKSAAPKYVIPVVFHVLHNGGPENISEEQILSAVDRLNECFQGNNPELATVQPEFQALTTTLDIEFKLAKKAPDGSCFNGITRTKSSETDSGNEFAQLNAIINGNDVYQGNWPINEYLNIFVVKELSSPGAAAYASFPSTTTSMARGVWSKHEYIGSTGTSTAGRSGTVVHELGHWFALYHPWGSKGLVNSDPSPSDCGVEDDFVQDTPETIGNKSCNVNANTCDADNAYWGYDIKDNVENFMEYSYCFKMFTIGQGDRMEAALEDPSLNRYNIWQASNLTKTGVNEPDQVCVANFSTDYSIICAGETVKFNDESYSGQTEWTWTFEGGSVVSGSINDQTPEVLYSTPGVYDVSLTISDGSNSVSTTKQGYITVLENPGKQPAAYEDFEDTESIPNENWLITNEFSSDYNIVDEAAESGLKSLKITNASSKTGNVYELMSYPIDLSNIDEPIITFDWAFAKRLDENNDNLKILVSNDCGKTFTSIRFMTALTLTTAPATQSKFVPTKDQWKNIVIDIPIGYNVSNSIVKFEFTSDGGNHFYFDDINIGNKSLLAVDNIHQDINTLSIYPNPAKNVINIDINLDKASNVMIEIYDVVGRKVHTEVLGKQPLGNSESSVNINHLKAGTYLANINVDGITIKTERLIKE